MGYYDDRLATRAFVNKFLLELTMKQGDLVGAWLISIGALGLKCNLQSQYLELAKQVLKYWKTSFEKTVFLPGRVRRIWV